MKWLKRPIFKEKVVKSKRSSVLNGDGLSPKLANRLYQLFAFLLPIVVMLGTFRVVGIYPFGESTIMSGDYHMQYIPLYRGLGHLFKSGDWGALYWSWHKGLGGVMGPVWGFNSFSPLSLLIGLAPTSQLNNAVVLVTLLRYGLSSLSFYYFLYRRYQVDQNRLLGLVLALAYGLNGYFLTNQVNPNFLDNLILFPLLILGAEKILDGQKSIKYTLVLGTMLVMQFYTAYMALLFVVLYAVFYSAINGRRFSEAVTSIGRLAAYSILGGLLSAVWLLPIFYALLETKVAGASSESWSVEFLNNPLDFLLKFLPGTTSEAEWHRRKALPPIYIGLIGLLGLTRFVVLSRIKGRTKWLTLVLMLLLAVAFSNYAPIRVWHMLQLPVGFYHRNAFVLSFFFLLVAYWGLRGMENWTRGQVLGQGLLLVGVLAWAFKTQQTLDYLLLSPEQLVFSAVLLAVFVLVLLLPQWSGLGLLVVLALTMLELGVNAGVTMKRTLWLAQVTLLGGEADLEQTYRDLKIDQSGLTRLEKSSVGTFNDALSYHYYGVNHFSSSIEYQTLEFLGRLGLPSDTSMSAYTGGTPLTDVLINLNQFIDTGWGWSVHTRWFNTSYFEEVSTASHFRLLRNPSVLGLGYSGSADLMTLELQMDNPIANQNTLYKRIFGEEVDILEPITPGYVSIYFDNMIVDPAYGGQVMKRDSPARPATIRLAFTPQDNRSYYLYAPKITKWDIRALTANLNGNDYRIQDRYRHPQLWGVATAADGQTQILEFTLDNDDPIDLEGISVYAFDDERFKAAMAKQSVSTWRPTTVRSTYLAGEVDQLEGYQYLYTSVPYNEGWHVKVDGQPVRTEKAFGAMVAFKLPPGQHRIEMTYTPPGIFAGGLLTGIGLLMLIIRRDIPLFKLGRLIEE